MTKLDKPLPSGSPAPTPPRLPQTEPLPGPKAKPNAPQSEPAIASLQPFASGAQDVPPPVSRSFFRWRHGILVLSFLVFVVVPSLLSAWYLWARASDQFVSRVGFAVRLEDNSSAIELLGGLTSLSGSSSSDTDILYEFIQSQRLVSDIDAALNLRAIWSRPERDPIFRLQHDASLEELVAYWNSMVRLSYGAGSGLIEVEVRAFNPEDATRIADKLFERSSEKINELSAIAREDAIGYAREELDVAVERLKEARETVTRFRNENQLINPEIDLQSQAGLLSTLQAQQAEALIEIDLLSETAQSRDPRFEQAQRRLAVIEKRIAAERQKLGFRGANGDDKAFSEIIGEYERLVVDREFAEQAYLGALTAFDAAQAEARRKTRYLAAYMEPTRAETAEYPKRITALGLVSLFLFLIWSIAALVGYSIKDRR